MGWKRAFSVTAKSAARAYPRGSARGSYCTVEEGNNPSLNIRLGRELPSA